MDAVSNVLSAVSGSPLAWVPFAALALGFGLVIWRTQSLHFLLRRFWLLVHGSKDIADADVRAFVDEQTSLQSFRLFSGVKVSTLENAKRLMAWCKQHGISIAKVSECRDCFDPDECRVRIDTIPGKAWRLICALWGMAWIIVGMTSFSAIFYAAGLVQLKATDRWVFFAEDQARRAFSLPFLTNALDAGDCKTRMPQRIARSGFSDQEVDIVCGLLEKPEWGPYVSDLESRQRWTFALLTLLCMLIFYGAYRDLSKWMAAREILDKTQRSDGDDMPGSQASAQAAAAEPLALEQPRSA